MIRVLGSNTATGALVQHIFLLHWWLKKRAAWNLEWLGIPGFLPGVSKIPDKETHTERLTQYRAPSLGPDQRLVSRRAFGVKPSRDVGAKCSCGCVVPMCRRLWEHKKNGILQEGGPNFIGYTCQYDKQMGQRVWRYQMISASFPSMQ